MAMTKLILLAIIAMACVSASFRPHQQSYRPHAPTHYRPHVQPHYRPRTHYTVASWSAWGRYGRCSKPCGGGIQFRYRTCEKKQVYGYGPHGNSNCAGPMKSMKYCNLQCCPVNGGWAYWTNWSNNPHTYKQTRTRTCSKPYPSCGGRKCYGADSQTRNVPKPHYNPQPHRQQPHRQPHRQPHY